MTYDSLHDRMLDYLADPSQWTKKSYLIIKDPETGYVHHGAWSAAKDATPEVSKVCPKCLYGLIGLAAKDHFPGVRFKGWADPFLTTLMMAMGEVANRLYPEAAKGGSFLLVNFNDHPATTHDEALRVVRESREVVNQFEVLGNHWGPQSA